MEPYERDGTLTWVGSQGTFRASIDHEGNFAYRVSERATLRQAVGRVLQHAERNRSMMSVPTPS